MERMTSENLILTGSFGLSAAGFALDSPPAAGETVAACCVSDVFPFPQAAVNANSNTAIVSMAAFLIFIFGSSPPGFAILLVSYI
jgi:hypothetical protein